MSTPRFSILIPSFNRKEYLFHTLQTCLNQSFLNCEFVVIDDCSQDDTHSMMVELSNQDSRLKYIRNENNLGMLLNFEEGLKICIGEYIIVLGSDDGLMPDSLQSLDVLITKTNAELITWPTPAFFYEGTKMSTSQLVYPKALKKHAEPVWLKSSDFFERNADELAYVGDKMCPMLYVKSVAKKELITSVIQKSGGKFYSCSTPDGYSAFALLCEVDQYLYCSTAYSLHGVSPSSAGVNYVKAIDPKNDLSEKFFNDSKNRKLHHFLANSEYSPLISVMTADFILTSQDIVGTNKSKVSIDIENLLKKACKELCDGLMDEKKIPREIKILAKIAEKHNLSAFLDNLLENSYRNKRKTLEGDAISPSVFYLNMTSKSILNVYDASIYVKEVLEGSKSLRFSSLYFIFNSLRYLLLGKLKTDKNLLYFAD